MKKHITLFAILLLCAASLFAQSPEQFTYQAVVRNASNALVTNAQVGVRVNILQGTATGNAVYSETHVTTCNANGLVTVSIGGGTVQQGTFAGIDWSDGPYFLKTDIDPNGGNDYTITSVQQLLSVPYALYAKEAGNTFSGDYNDLTNTPTIPTVPTNVSAFTNDAGYITMDSIPAIPTVPTAVSAFTNDAGYLTSYTETDPQFTAWDKDYNDLTNKPELFDGDYNSLANKPVIPTVPTNVSAFNNDAGYLTNFTEQQVLSISNDTIFLTGGSFVKLPTGFDGDYNSLTNKPELFSGDYNDLTNQPTIPTVPTNVSAFTNDAGYITIDSIPNIPIVPTDVSVFNNDAGYITMDSVPTIPTNVSAFTNDAGYITGADVQEAANIPTNVSAFTNDAGYLTSFTEQQVLSLSHDTLFLTGGSFVKLPAGFDGDYNSLTNKPELFSGDYNDLTNQPIIPTVPTNVSAFTNDAGYITEASCNGMNICESLATLQSQVDSLQQSSLLPEAQAQLPIVVTTVVTDSATAFPTYGGNVTSDGGSVVSAKGVCWNTTGSPTLFDNHTIDGGGVGAFLSDLRSLIRDTTYYVRAYATNSAGTSYGTQMIFIFREYQQWDGTGLNPNDAQPCREGAVVTDHVGNVYNTMQIGNQCWMRENLRDASGNEHIFWPDVLQACPTGWHLPDNEDWNTLGNYMGLLSSNAPSNLVNFGNGDYWTSTTSTWNQYTFIGYPTVQSYSVVFGLTLEDVNYTGYILSVRCVRDRSVHTASSTFTVMTASVSDIAATSIICSSNVTSDGGSVVSAKGVCWNTTGNPTVSDNHTIDGGGVGTFESILHDLAVGTTYYVRAYATSSGGTSYSNQKVINFHGGYQTWDGSGLNPNDAFACQGIPTVTDHEGNVYNTVQIGNQCWTRENMRCTTSPSTGTTILDTVSTISYTGKKATYVNGSTDNIAIYGLQYNWNAAMDTFNTAFGETSTNSNQNNSVNVTFSGPRRGICPEGWHVPSDAEWTQLKEYVSSQSIYTCGGHTIVKALSSTLWEWNPGDDSCTMVYYPSTNNATGFSIVPVGYYVNFWSTTQFNNWQAYDRWTSSEYSTLNRCNVNSKSNRFSVRCLRDTNSVTGNNSPASTLDDVQFLINNAVDSLQQQIDSLREVDNAMQQQIDSLSELNDAMQQQIDSLNEVNNATQQQVDSLNEVIDAIIADDFHCGLSTVTDHEGNVYNTVKIGQQCWTKENLRTTTSPTTGTYLIPSPGTTYTYTGKQAFWYNNDSATYAPKNYGLLYNWNAAVDTFNTAFGETSVNTSTGEAEDVIFSGHRRGICPAGWHLPSDAEWNTMEATVSGLDWQTSYETTSGAYRGNHAGKLAGGNNWYSNSTSSAPGDYSNANRNESGFSVVPAGRCYGSSFTGEDLNASFWSSSQDADWPNSAYSRDLRYFYVGVNRKDNEKLSGFSVRCIRD